MGTSTDYDRVRRHCTSRGELWEDPDFPAAQSSVFYHQTPPFAFQWRRPRELSSRPQLVAPPTEPALCDVSAGKMGDRWLVQCLCVLYTCKGLFYRVVPADQGFESGGNGGYCGVFRFRLWWCGEWTEVLVDDRLPTVNGRLAFVHSSRTDQYWAALLEKAYAKLHGSYEALKYGTLLDGLADLTGGVAESIPVANITDFTLTIRKLINMTSVITCVMQPSTSIQPQTGILPSINYRIMSINEETIRLTDPTGGNDLTVSVQEFQRTFTHIECVHLDADTARDEPSLRDKNHWHMRQWHGRWQKGCTAGGCRNNPETFHINPQLQLTTISNTEEIVVSLNQHSILEPKVIGFTAYKIPTPTQEQLPKQWFKKNKSLVNSQYTNSRQVSGRCKADEHILVLPTTFEPGQECGFTMRVLAPQPVKLRALDTIPRQLKQAVIKSNSDSNPVSSGFHQYEAVFLQLADEHRTVNAFELQELLDACLPNDYIKSCASLEVCRQAVAAIGTGNIGRISLNEFRDLMCSLKQWQGVFKTHTREKTGILKAERLREALVDTGYQLDTDTLATLLTRYMRKDGTLRFGDFVAIVLHLAMAFRTFQNKDTQHTGTIRLTLAEWLKSSLTC